MKNTKIKIKIEFEDSLEEVNSSPIKIADGNFEIIFSQDKKNLIDRSEEALLKANSQAIRDVISNYLSELSKKKSIEISSNKDIIIEEKIFKVDGEVGRFNFKIYNCRNIEDNLFPSQKGKKYYKTFGFKELAYFQGSCDKSYRKTAELINRVRYQLQNGTPYRTINSGVEQESRAINEKIDKKTSVIFENNNFKETACPKEGENIDNVDFKTLSKEEVQNKLNELKTEIPDKKLSNSLTVGNVKFEASEHTTNISIDDICVKRQKIKRETAKIKREKELENIPEQTKEEAEKLNKKNKKREYA